MKDKSGLWCTSKENVQGGTHQENWDLEIEDPAEWMFFLGVGWDPLVGYEINLVDYTQNIYFFKE